MEGISRRHQQKIDHVWLTMFIKHREYGARTPGVLFMKQLLF